MMKVIQVTCISRKHACSIVVRIVAPRDLQHLPILILENPHLHLSENMLQSMNTCPGFILVQDIEPLQKLLPISKAWQSTSMQKWFCTCKKSSCENFCRKILGEIIQFTDIWVKESLFSQLLTFFLYNVLKKRNCCA